MRKVVLSGLFLFFAIFIGLVICFPRYLSSWRGWLVFVGISSVPTLLYMANVLERPSEENALKGKTDAMYPPVNNKLLFRYPTGVVMGRDKATKKYVCKSLRNDGHVLVIGGSGSGKSSCLVIPTILSNRDFRAFAVDIKGELYKKTCRDKDRSKVISLSDRSLCGYDPFYLLNGEPSSQDVLELMQLISSSLIPISADIHDDFWKRGARNLLVGLMLFNYKKGIHSFIGIIDEILSRPVRESIDNGIETSRPTSSEYKYLNEFAIMQDETLSGIVAEVINHIQIFSNDQDVRYALRDNPEKASPLDLEKGKSIFLAVNEEKLSAYYDLMQLVLNQTLSFLETRPEDSEPLIFIIDELPRLLSEGKIEKLLDAARTLRSRNVTLMLVTQSAEALMTAYTENEVTDLMSNCPYKIILSASSYKTQKAVCDWAGKFRQKRTTWSGSGPDRKVSISYEERDILDPSDLLTLPESGEAILISPYGYSRIRKTPYFKDRILRLMAEEI